MKTPRILSTALLVLAASGGLMAQPAPQAPAAAAPAPVPALPAPPAAAPAAAGATIVGEEQRGTATREAGTNGQDTLTVDFPETEVRVIVSSVADLFDLNVVVPESLQGKTSIKLRGVTWRQIFQTVLDPVGFTYIVEGNIIKVISRDTLQAEPTEIYPVILNYAKAGDLLSVISPMINTAAGGKIAVEPRINALLITERPTAMNKIMPVILQLDTATAQVMIETKFIEVTDGDIKNLGVNWSALKAYKVAAGGLTGSFDRKRGQEMVDGLGASTAQSGANTTGTTASQGVTSGAGGSTASLSNAINSSITSGIDTTLNFLNDVANSGSTARSSSAVFSASEFGFVLSALNELSRTKIISNPTIVTMNNTEAIINVGEEDPIPNYSYNEQRGSFEVAGFTYKAIGIILKVTPQANAGGIIRLTVEPTVSQKNGTVNFGGAGGAEIPIIATRNAKTQVSLKDGYTMGIGGLLRQQSDNSGNSVPLISRIPFLGRAFQNKSRTETTSNLLIFITAKTVAADGGSVDQIFDPRQVRGTGIQKTDLPGFRDGSDPFAPVTPAMPSTTKR